jgi:hypothetical protein
MAARMHLVLTVNMNRIMPAKKMAGKRLGSE